AITQAYDQFLSAVERAVRNGTSADDLTHGYSLMADPECRAFQERFRDFAEQNVPLLRDVLRNSGDDTERAAAAYIIGYAPKKRGVVADLLYAVQDSNDSVRNNAVRSLAAIAVLARRDDDPDLKIPPTWFIEMLNSLVWSDRNKAALALVTLTEDRPASVLEQLRDRALPALVEMAQWKSLGHALPAYMLLGRAGGLSEKEIMQSWQRGERVQMIMRVANSLGAKR
ncbi:MAG: hypothetical protein M1436_09425, partial [Acidobacteria bacterium]|nr:hypothetical protein [Acidobacteriota bacterium]